MKAANENNQFPEFSSEAATIYNGDCRDVMRMLIEAGINFDSIVTDPPYGLSFMGKGWDHGVPGVEFWELAFLLLKPGGHLAAFGGSRTFHRLACAIEDAGFEIRDSLMWLYGSGFPKSLDVGKAASTGQWQGFGTALKPAHEPIILARKPIKSTVAANVLEHGTGALNIDGCRVAWPDGAVPEIGTPGWGGGRKKLSVVPGQTEANTVVRSEPNKLGRWPANVLHDGSPAVLAEFAACGNPEAYRFFYCAKAATKDRNEGLEPGGRNIHPTVKPTDLMRWLCRLVTPPGGMILDPFCGSGSTGKGALREGFTFVGVEQDVDYFEIAAQRVRAA